MSNKTFGDIPFITFYDTVLSRLAYFTSENFLPRGNLKEDIN
jgi:hypothetical protein